jgi:hypothetical protein
MRRPPPVLLPHEVLPWDPADEAAAARRQRAIARKTAAASLSLMGLIGLFIELFKPTAKPIVFEQHQPGNADPLDRDPAAGPFAGTMRVPGSR